MLADVTLTHELLLLAIGLAAGLIGGMLGVGGGILMIPAMVIILGEGEQAFGEYSIHVYKLAAITTSLALSVPAVVRHQRARAIVRRMPLGIVPLALVGVGVGVLLAGTFVGAHAVTLRRLFGVALEGVVALNAFQDWRARRAEPSLFDRCPLPSRRVLIGAVVGLPAGFIAGLLGIGGGVWAVPSQRLLLGVQIRNAIANSAVMILFVSVATSLGLAVWLGSQPAAGRLYLTGWWLAVWLSPGALVGGWFGASLTHRLPVRALRWAFQGLLLVTGLKLIFS